MERLLGPKCFLSSSFFLLTILSTYGIVGVVLNYLQVSKLHNFGGWPFNLRPVFHAFMIIQSLFPAAGLFAILGGCKKQPMFLYCSGFVLLGISTCCSIFGTVAIRASSQDMVTDFYSTFKKNHKNLELHEWMNDIQWQHQCCGVYSYMDWYLFQTEDVINKVPPTCCKRGVVPEDGCGGGILGKDESSRQAANEKLIYTSGCGSKISKIISEVSFRLGMEMWLAGIISFSVAVFLFIGVTKLYILTGNSLQFQTTEHGSLSGNPRGGTNATPTVERKNDSFNAYVVADENNNNIRPQMRSSFSKRESKHQRSSEIRKKRQQKPVKTAGAKKKVSSKQLLSFAPALSHTKLIRSYPSKTKRMVSLSKSFILGDAPSHILNAAAGKATNEARDSDILRKNVDMLWYQSLDKNYSTMSTTPTATSSMTVAAMLQNRKLTANDFSAVMNDAFSQRNTVYTLVSERPFTPSLSNNCSVPFFNNFVQLPNGEVGALEQLSPHFTFPGEEESEEGASPANSSFQFPVVSPVSVPVASPNGTKVGIVWNNNEEGEESSDPILLLSNNVAQHQNSSSGQGQGQQSSPPPPPPTSTTSSKYATCSVRSTTLATIHEESESVKGSPLNTKAASPASGYMTPESLSPKQTKVFQVGLPDSQNQDDSDQMSFPPQNNNVLNEVEMETDDDANLIMRDQIDMKLGIITINELSSDAKQAGIVSVGQQENKENHGEQEQASSGSSMHDIPDMDVESYPSFNDEKRNSTVT